MNLSPKQDRTKPRTVEDLQRMYNFKEMSDRAKKSETSASKQNTSYESQLYEKVGRDEYEQIVRMLNRAESPLTLTSDRLEIKGNAKDIESGKSVELFRFVVDGISYSLNLHVTANEDGLAFDGFAISKIANQTPAPETPTETPQE